VDVGLGEGERGGVVVRGGWRSAEGWRMDYSGGGYICMFAIELVYSFEMQPLSWMWTAGYLSVGSGEKNEVEVGSEVGTFWCQEYRDFLRSRFLRFS
jgi:hypothetical protein